MKEEIGYINYWLVSVDKCTQPLPIFIAGTNAFRLSRYLASNLARSICFGVEGSKPIVMKKVVPYIILKIVEQIN